MVRSSTPQKKQQRKSMNKPCPDHEDFGNAKKHKTTMNLNLSRKIVNSCFCFCNGFHGQELQTIGNTTKPCPDHGNVRKTQNNQHNHDFQVIQERCKFMVSLVFTVVFMIRSFKALKKPRENMKKAMPRP